MTLVMKMKKKSDEKSAEKSSESAEKSADFSHWMLVLNIAIEQVAEA